MTDDDAAGDRPVVLAVDDHERVARSFEIWLSDDYDVRTALDGEAALAAVDDSVDVVLLDRHMPGRSGDEVLAAIRDHGLDVPVAMITAVKPDEAPLAPDYQAYLTKPAMRDEIGTTVRTLLDGAEATTEDAADDGPSPDAAGDDPLPDTDRDGSDDAADGDSHLDVDAGTDPTVVPDSDGAEETDGRAHTDLRSTLDDVSARLDRIQDVVGDVDSSGETDPGGDTHAEADPDAGTDTATDPDEKRSDDGGGLVTPEDVRTSVSDRSGEED